jgi:SAM-dependent methyltransferase
MASAGYRVLAEHDFLPNQTFTVFGDIPPMGANAGKVWGEMHRRPDAPLRTGATPVFPAAIEGLRPGKALDFGMGLWRNALFLADRGWEVTGVDLSDEAMQQVSTIARDRGYRLEAIKADSCEWDLGKGRWDLIVAANMHSLLVANAERIVTALKPGGLLIVEGFHADVKGATNFKVTVRVPPGHPSNQLPEPFESLRVLRYEDSLAVAERQKGLPPTDSRVELVAYEE